MLRPLESLVAAIRADTGVGRTVLVPVPTTLQRARDRGYNQAARLAADLALGSGRVQRDLLVRTHGDRTSQTGLDPAHRRANVEGAFSVTPGAGPMARGTICILVDDVLTTGATAQSAARVLIEAGAEAVGLVTYARALPEGAGIGR